VRRVGYSNTPRYPLNTFITPPITRKRKAVEEAATTTTTPGDDDDNNHSTKSANAAKHPKTLPLERSVQGKRQSSPAARTEKAEDKESSPSLSRNGASVVTPTTTTRSMDSDDDFMTDVSSREEDFLDTQDSDDESLGEG
jgi:hypothetical protein